jgi:hypothetical protein
MSLISSRVFEYLKTKFADAVDPRFDYNNAPIPPPADLKYTSAMMYDNETMIIGIPRLRQVRILPSKEIRNSDDIALPILIFS